MNSLKQIFDLFEGKHYRYLLVGFFIFFINLLVTQLILGIPYFYESSLKQNIGHAIAIEVSLLISFPLHNYITWLENSDQLLQKFVRFQLASTFGIFIRIILFAVLTWLGLSWVLATIISILIIIIFNFVGFDLFVFSLHYREAVSNEESYTGLGEGVGTLETIEEARTYNRWIAGKVLDYLGQRNLEIGAGTGTIAAITSEDFPIEVYELSKYNITALKRRFKKNSNITKIGNDIFSIQKKNQYDCIYSSNVLEHIENDVEVVNHSLGLLKKGGFFVAIVPAMPLLYSDFDKKIGHFRRYSMKDIHRWKSRLASEYKVGWVVTRYFNPIGALGWFVKMKLLRSISIRKQDAMFMNSLIPFVSWLDSLPLPFGQSMLIVLKKI